MKPRDIFKIAIKIVGLYILLRGLESLLEGMIVTLGAQQSHYSSRYWGIWGIVQTVAGLLIIRFETPLPDMAFPESSDRSIQKPTEPLQPKPASGAGPSCVSCAAGIPVGASYCPASGYRQPV